jgi:hypothetical protein
MSHKYNNNMDHDMTFLKLLQKIVEDVDTFHTSFESTDAKTIINHLMDFFDFDRQANKWADPRLRQREFKRCFGSSYEDDGYFGKDDNPAAWNAGWREGWVDVNGVRIFFAFNGHTNKLVADTKRIALN